MNIAIQAADLDAERIDGTRVYILNLLKNFGQLDRKNKFSIYHRTKFNPELTPPDFSNYKIVQKNFPCLWTQTRFSWEIWKSQPDILWMPMQSLPIFRRKKLKTVVTIHDLAFKYFPESFPKKDLRKLNFFTSHAIHRANKIIAVSQSTKEDILKFYPEINSEKIKVIHHGFDASLFYKESSKDKLEKFLTSYGLQFASYLLYVGALQPRKNLVRLIEAFEKIKPTKPDLKLVLVGEKAWLFEKILKKINQSSYKKDILLPGRISFKELYYFYQGASIFLFPSLYEGFGLPILEAQALEIPVITANNSSLPEVAGEGAKFVDVRNAEEIAKAILEIENHPEIKKDLIQKGLKNINNFSWKKCAEETLDCICF